MEVCFVCGEHGGSIGEGNGNGYLGWPLVDARGSSGEKVAGAACVCNGCWVCVGMKWGRGGTYCVVFNLVSTKVNEIRRPSESALGWEGARVDAWIVHFITSSHAIV